jgi:hypothetical protein
MSPADPATKPGKSFAQLRAVWQSALTRAQKAVLQVLLTYARPDLTVYHAEAELAWAAEYTVPTVCAALTTLRALGVLTVLKKSRQRYATEYRIDLTKLPTRPPYPRRMGRPPHPTDRGPHSQPTNDLQADEDGFGNQTTNDLDPDRSQPINDSRQPINPLHPIDIRETTTEEPFSANREPPPEKKSAPYSRSQPRLKTPAPTATPAPDELPITDDLQAWSDDNALGLDLPRIIEQFLLYTRAKGYTNVDWYAALRLYILNGHNRQGHRNGQRPGMMADPIVEAVRHQPRLEASAPPEPPPGGEQAWRRMGPYHGWHVECDTIHQFYGACPGSGHQKITPPTDHGPTPEYSAIVLRQIEAAARLGGHGLSGLDEVLVAVVSNGNGPGHHPNAQEAPHERAPGAGRLVPRPGVEVLAGADSRGHHESGARRHGGADPTRPLDATVWARSPPAVGAEDGDRHGGRGVPA